MSTGARAAPTLVVAGAPWQPLLDGLPRQWGKALTRETLTGGWSRPLRAVGGFLLRPWVAVVLFSPVMVAWHLPVLFDLAANNEAVHIWLMHGTYFVAGVLCLQFIPWQLWRGDGQDPFPGGRSGLAATGWAGGSRPRP